MKQDRIYHLAIFGTCLGALLFQRLTFSTKIREK